VIKLFGFLVRSMIFFKDNYLGLNLNFITLDEYRSRLQSSKSSNNLVDTSTEARVLDDFVIYSLVFC
jgi:hypothetical protein